MGLESAQYTHAIKVAKSTGALTFVGHSLGGGLASAAAIHTSGKAVVFNAAGIRDSTINNLDRSRANIKHYYSGYDAVSVVNAVFRTNVPGTQINMGHGGWHLMGDMCKVMGTSC
jgi:pimeloyl-ACP methyl ester carboxylesterase